MLPHVKEREPDPRCEPACRLDAYPRGKSLYLWIFSQLLR